MNYPGIVNGIDFRDLVMVAGDSVLTTSVEVAE
ncbi:Rha family transcriptional regulator, partial [Escherichia coli]|nr:Rha family transcriptional regulator [Escherichia coli]